MKFIIESIKIVLLAILFVLLIIVIWFMIYSLTLIDKMCKVKNKNMYNPNSIMPELLEFYG